MPVKIPDLTEENLIFAAYARCPCGAGLAYVNESTLSVRQAHSLGRLDCWDCSAILLGRAIPSGQPGWTTHTQQLPFVFWSVKSEQQPSVAGQTTRPYKPTPAL